MTSAPERSSASRFQRIPLLVVAVLTMFGHAAAPRADGIAAFMAGNVDLAGSVSFETRIFPGARSYSAQDRATVSPSLVLAPEIVHEWSSGDNRLTFIPFARIDAHDDSRTHADIRELHWLHAAADWDLTVGFGKVFWGVAESRHLVDIINQTDGVEGVDGEEKLGQPMVHLNWHTTNGSLGLFILPGFRERTFADDTARLRGGKPVQGDDATYDSTSGDKHVDLAARWSHTIGDVDVAVSHFHGTSREPTVNEATVGGAEVFIPHYDRIGQTGLEAQLTRGAWLWKLEAMTRSGHGNRFAAAVAGFEYTLYQIAGSSADLGILTEYLYDGRDAGAPATAANNDVFAGARLTLNNTADTELLAGAIVDRITQETALSLETAHRLSDHWKLEAEARWSVNVPTNGFFAGSRNDDFLQVSLQRFF